MVATPTGSPVHRRRVPTASPADALRLLAGVVLPVVARGAIVRRPRVVADVARRVREEAPAPSTDPTAPVARRPVLRAVVLESLRLWPTTPAVLRETTTTTTWRTGELPERTGVLVLAPFFHRDVSRLPQAHRFAPELWRDEDGQEDPRGAVDWPLVPFSAGPGMCPGRGVVLLTTSTLLASLAQQEWRPAAPRLSSDRPLPSTLNPFSLHLLPA